MAVTYYDVLGVEPDAATAVIRRAYVELARRYHPDLHASTSPADREANERAMQAINEAWAVLSDPVARRRYDETLGLGDAKPWQPFDASDDAYDDDVDPRLIDDGSPFAATRRKQVVMVLPTLTFFAGVGLVVLGLVINLLPLSALGLVAILASALAFVVLPLLAMSASARNDRR